MDPAETTRTVRLTDAGNTIDHALAAIRARGYSVFLYPGDGADGGGEYWAIKDGRDFVSDNPVTVLGLIALWEQFGDGWRDVPVPGEHDRLGDRTFPEDRYASLGDAEFAALVDDLRIFFDAVGVPFPEAPSRDQLADLMLSYHKEPREPE